MIAMIMKKLTKRKPLMKINHKLIRQIIQIIGVSAFLVSIFFKLKAIILMGGTKSISDSLESNENPVTGHDIEAVEPQPACESY